jgi:hypothetical protein
MLNIPCKCGHLEQVHLKHGGITNQPDVMCTECFSQRNKTHWHYFSPDNLSYIETLAKEKGLV